MSKFSQLSPVHEVCFGGIEQLNEFIYYFSNIDRVKLGGVAEVIGDGAEVIGGSAKIIGLDKYHVRNGVPFIGNGIIQIVPQAIEYLFERDQRIKEKYGWPEPSLLTYETQGEYHERIVRAMSGRVSEGGILLPFEDSNEIFNIANELGLVMLNENGVADRLNDKVEMLTQGLNRVEGINVPRGKEIHNKEELLDALTQLEANKEFEDSILSVKVSYSASGCGIKKGTYAELIRDLNNPLSELARWVEASLADENQRVMVQEYFSGRVKSSPGVQFCINDNGSVIIGASNQIFAVDGQTHMGNKFSPEVLQNPKVLDAVQKCMRFAAEAGYRGIMGVDLIIYEDQYGELHVAFMEYNARGTGAVPAALGVSMVTGELAVEKEFVSDNNFPVRNTPFEKIEEVLTSSRFMPDNGEGVICISTATMSDDPNKSKLQLVFLGDDPAAVKRDFREALGL